MLSQISWLNSTVLLKKGDLARLILVSTAFEILFPEIASLNDTMLSYAEL
jgi:hypothetical protein